MDKIIPKSWGEYPPEYNRAVHGDYNPSVYYGKRDTPFTQVKLGELFSWISRRNKSPKAMAGAISRAWWRYQLNWVQPKKPGPYVVYHFFAAGIALFFILDFNKQRAERRYRYH